jgi:hypothetical protein
MRELAVTLAEAWAQFRPDEPSPVPADLERELRSGNRKREVDQPSSASVPVVPGVPGSPNEDAEERAAILEFEAGLDRDEAERRAVRNGDEW